MIENSTNSAGLAETADWQRSVPTSKKLNVLYCFGAEAPEKVRRVT
jgi:hypothetical protein